MTTKVQRSIDAPLRTHLTHDQTWRAADKGLIKCWEIGRAMAETNPDVVEKCLQGELPPLGWKGGVSRTLVKLEKFGTLNYLAQWQGLRGEDLNLDLEEERTLTCTKTGMIVTFTPIQSKYSNQI
ncbi:MULTISPECIES: hypothetical protein [Pseudomonas]|uniref:hypothetical protein n=1 Tax=Pseudomonas TaxID=286 RepID=UPI0021F88EB7|nr:hypothetical protein [Pseudomonas putida]MDF3928967.1 hypothetical protein [Pseudomonas putida]